MMSQISTSKGSFYLQGTLLILLMVWPSVACGQEKAPKTDRKTFVKEMIELLNVGVSDAKIVSYWDKKGWPESISDIEFILIRNAKASPSIQRRLRQLLEGHAVLSDLAENYQPFEFNLDSGAKLSLLRPRGWQQTQTKGQDRFYFHEHAADLPGWFRRTSLFVWVLDGGTWKKRNEMALSRIVMNAAKERLTRAGLSVGIPQEGRLLVKRGRREFAIIETICRDPEDKLKGTIAMSALVQEHVGKVIVVGYSTRLNPDVPQQKKPRDILAQVLATLKVVKPKK